MVRTLEETGVSSATAHQEQPESPKVPSFTTVGHQCSEPNTKRQFEIVNPLPVTPGEKVLSQHYLSYLHVQPVCQVAMTSIYLVYNHARCLKRIVSLAPLCSLLLFLL